MGRGAYPVYFLQEVPLGPKASGVRPEIHQKKLATRLTNPDG
jgi:hypothetical protein